MDRRFPISGLGLPRWRPGRVRSWLTGHVSRYCVILGLLQTTACAPRLMAELDRALPLRAVDPCLSVEYRMITGRRGTRHNSLVGLRKNHLRLAPTPQNPDLESGLVAGTRDQPLAHELAQTAQRLQRAIPLTLGIGLSLSVALMATGVGLGVSASDSQDTADPRFPAALALSGTGIGLFFSTLVGAMVTTNYATPFFNQAIIQYNDQAAEQGCPNP